MNNVNNETPEKTLQASALQHSVEEDYLNSLLSPLLVNEERNDPVMSQTGSEKSTHQPAVVHDVKNDDKETDSTQSSNPSDVAGAINGSLQSMRQMTPFSCQLVSVAGLKLALPLFSYTKILPWSDQLVLEQCKQPCLIGHVQYDVCVFDVVDLARLITGRPANDQANNGEHFCSHVLLLQDGSTCLPCNDLLDIVTLEPEKVCWRNSDSKRIWLAGTVKDEGYALLDIEGIMKLIEHC